MSGALMMPEEEVCYVSWLRRAARVVEYGAGGSTVLAVKQRNVRHVCSIESDRAWFLQLKRRPRVRWAILRRRLSLHYVDIGPVGAWGSPIDPTAKERWPAYAQEPWLHET